MNPRTLRTFLKFCGRVRDWYIFGVHANLPRADAIAEVFDFLCVPLRLSGFHEKLGVLQGREHLVNVPLMLSEVLGKIRISSR